MLLTFTEFFGRFHPVVVHLPIGILILACLFQWLALKPKYFQLLPAISIMYFLGMCSAIAACTTGYLLTLSGNYEGDLVGQHQWLGIGTAVISCILFIINKFNVRRKIKLAASAIMLLLITITGHLGGSLTHGADYLTEGLSGGEDAAVRKPIPNINMALVYADLVQPALQAKCYNCHSSSKQKGKLRLDTKEFILKGGESGHTIVPGKPDESKLMELITLPLDHKEHMSPKEKPQLSSQEIELLRWWIAQGADFEKKVQDLQQTPAIKPVLASFQTGTIGAEPIEALADVPAKPIEKAANEIIAELKKHEVVIYPVAQNSNYLSVSFVNTTASVDTLLKILSTISKQVVWLKLDHSKISDSSLNYLMGFNNLSRLHLSHTSITDRGLTALKSLQDLQFLNLVGTQITAKGIAALQSIKNLQALYLYQTKVKSSDWTSIQKIFPKTRVDTGNYLVPTYESDTTEVKEVP